MKNENMKQLKGRCILYYLYLFITYTEEIKDDEDLAKLLILVEEVEALAFDTLLLICEGLKMALKARRSILVSTPIWKSINNFLQAILGQSIPGLTANHNDADANGRKLTEASWQLTYSLIEEATNTSSFIRQTDCSDCISLLSLFIEQAAVDSKG